MSSIIGVTVGTPVPQSDWEQKNPNRADYIKNKPDLDSMFGRTSIQINKLDKRVTNLEQGILPSPFVTDDGTAYQKSVPSNALPYAEVEKVGGMTRKCANLIPFPYANSSYEMNGITFTNNGDGSITVNGTATQQAYFILMSETSAYVNKTISASGGKSSQCQLVIINYGGDGNYYDSGQGVTATPIGDIGVWIVVSGGATINNEIIYPMLNEGSTALPYEPYFEGLRSAPVTEVESVGANLIDQDDVTLDESAFVFTNKPLQLSAGTYTFSFKAKNYSPTHMFEFQVKTEADVKIAGAISFINENNTCTFTISEKADRVYLYADSPIGGTYYDIMLNRGSTALPYSPYVRNTLPIPSAVQALDGYGEGVNESVYNYIDWEKKQFVQRVGCVDMGTLDWYVSDSQTSRFATEVPSIVSIAADTADVICGKYNSDVEWKDKTISHYKTRVYVFDSAYTDAETFKSAMSGVMLYYELAEPIITDISDILSEDNFIGVEGGGTVTFKNQYEYAVPSEITYRIKGANV